MTKTLRPGETRTFKSGPPNEGEYVVTQFAGHYETVFIPRLGPRQRMLDHEGVYEYEEPLNGADEYVDDPYNPGQKIPAWRAWAIMNKRGTYGDGT